MIQMLERELNGTSENEEHRIIVVSDRLLHINNNQVRVEIEENGDVDVAWTLNVSVNNRHVTNTGIKFQRFVDLITNKFKTHQYSVDTFFCLILPH